MLGDVARSLQILSRLRLKGFHISIDDYGTGFSNAEQLSRIPATELKIDRSLVTGVADKPRLSAIIDSTIKLANELNLTTVAEGVETEADLSALMALGVDVVQGYYLAKPFSPDLLNEWIKTDLKKLRG